MSVINEKSKKVETYFNEHEWVGIGIIGAFGSTIFITKSFTYGIVAAIVAALAVFAYTQFSSKNIVMPSLMIKKPRQRKQGEISLGTTEKDQREVFIDMESLNHTFIIGMTRYGKTRLVLALVAEFVQQFSAEELQLAFSDAKAISFNVFGKSKHLYAPIARNQSETEALISLVLTEMYKRLEMFGDYDKRICTNIDEYYEISGEKLPRIVVIFDEVADSVEAGSDAEKNLTTLAKMGLAAGIHLMLITQRPTNIGITHEITSQCQTIMSTFMKNPTEYGSVAKIPKLVYSQMRPEKGLFMVFSPEKAKEFLDVYPDCEGWGFLKSRYMENHVVEGIAIEDTEEDLVLPELVDIMPGWGGSEEDKFMALDALQAKLGRNVIPTDMVKRFGVNSRTAKTWLEKYYA